MPTKIKNRLIKEVKAHAGELVICMDQIYLLLPGIEEDEHDYYYRLFSLRDGYQLHLCVGGWFPIKNRLTKKEYDSIFRIFNLNYGFRKNVDVEIYNELKKIFDKYYSKKKK